MGKLDAYEAIRPLIRTGDDILWGPGGPIGSIISWWTGSPYCHVSKVIRFSEYDVDRVYLLEALDAGVVLTSLSSRLEGHGGNAWWFPLAGELEPARPFIASWALMLIGRKYDYAGLLGNIAGRISEDAKRVICSEYSWMGTKQGIRKAHVGTAKCGEAVRRLGGKVPRPADWPLLQECGIYGQDRRLLKKQGGNER